MEPLETKFLSLIAENRQRMLRLCRVYARGEQDREDLYQEVLFQIWRALPGYRGESGAATWLWRVALNTAISHVRKDAAAAAGRRGSVVRDQSQVERAVDPRGGAAGGAEPDFEALYGAIAQLDKVEKAVITLFLEELSYEEIGGVLGMRAGHVGVLLHRTKKKLFRLMESTAGVAR
jgi:RNA polymerase sigma-70 factor (ECF subfamily)